MPRSKRLLRLTILAYRNPSMTEDEFHDHWTNVHAPKVSAHLAKYGITKYTQVSWSRRIVHLPRADVVKYHTPSSMRNKLSSQVTGLGSDDDSKTMSLAEYDGLVELLMPDLSCYEEAIKDPYYAEHVSKDEATFFDVGRSHLTVGWEEVYIEDGKVVDLPVESREQA